MRMYIRDEAIIFVAVALLILCLPHICFAEPHVYWDAQNTQGTSSDANAGMKKSEAVISWARCVELGIYGDTIGLKIISGDTPSADVCRAINAKKADRIQRKVLREIIPGHGSVTEEDIDESADGGFRVRKRWIWETGVTSYGQPFERCIDFVEIVEVD